MDIIVGNKAKDREYDFLFVYESKVRELESVCLIGLELEKRGYSVAILCWWEPFSNDEFVPVKTKVLMAHAVYKDYSLLRELSFVDGYAKVINLQWEQIYSIKDLSKQSAPWKMEGLTHEIEHISWGKSNYRKLIDYDGISDQHIHVVGQVSMDFLRPEFRKFFLSKEELFRKYNLPLDKKVCLFISSFSLINLPNSVQEPELIELTNISIDSQRMILDWVEKVLDTYDDTIFIYRPHPSEADNQRLEMIKQKYVNFYVIVNEPVKQWILVSDTIYNWFSTSLGETFFANRGCHVLRPIQIPHDYDCSIFENGNFIGTYEQFEKSIGQKECDFPVPVQNIKDNYYYDESEPVYLRIVDLCEKVYKSPQQGLEYNRKTLSYRMESLKKNIKKSLLGKLLLPIKKKLDTVRPESAKDHNNRHYARYVREMSARNATDIDEVSDITTRIKECIK